MNLIREANQIHEFHSRVAGRTAFTRHASEDAPDARRHVPRHRAIDRRGAHLPRPPRLRHTASRSSPSSSTEGFLVCHGFCLMPTHYHLLGSFEDDMLTPAIHRLNRRYARRLQPATRRRGHVFDSPYSARVVRRRRRALSAARQYVAANPPQRSVAVEQRSTRTFPSSPCLVELAIWFGCAESERALRFMTSPPSDSPAGSKPLRS